MYAENAHIEPPNPTDPNMRSGRIWPNLNLPAMSGLEYMRARRVLHHDLKSSNIFITLEGQVNLGDLGIAKILLIHSRKSGIGRRYAAVPVAGTLRESPVLLLLGHVGTRVYALRASRFKTTARKPVFSTY